MLLFGKWHVKINYSEPSVILKLLELPHMVKTGPEPGSLRVNQDVVSATLLISMKVFAWKSRWDCECEIKMRDERDIKYEFCTLR